LRDVEDAVPYIVYRDALHCLRDDVGIVPYKALSEISATRREGACPRRQSYSVPKQSTAGEAISLPFLFPVKKPSKA